MRDPKSVTEMMAAIIRSVPETKIDYIAAVDPDTLEPVTVIREGTLLALAVFVGKIRLIDNIFVRLKE